MSGQSWIQKTSKIRMAIDFGHLDLFSLGGIDDVLQ